MPFLVIDKVLTNPIPATSSHVVGPWDGYATDIRYYDKSLHPIQLSHILGDQIEEKFWGEWLDTGEGAIIVNDIREYNSPLRSRYDSNSSTYYGRVLDATWKRGFIPTLIGRNIITGYNGHYQSRIEDIGVDGNTNSNWVQKDISIDDLPQLVLSTWFRYTSVDQSGNLIQIINSSFDSDTSQWVDDVSGVSTLSVDGSQNQLALSLYTGMDDTLDITVGGANLEKWHSLFISYVKIGDDYLVTGAIDSHEVTRSIDGSGNTGGRVTIEDWLKSTSNGYLSHVNGSKKLYTRIRDNVEYTDIQIWNTSIGSYYSQFNRFKDWNGLTVDNSKTYNNHISRDDREKKTTLTNIDERVDSYQEGTVGLINRITLVAHRYNTTGVIQNWSDTIVIRLLRLDSLSPFWNSSDYSHTDTSSNIDITKSWDVSLNIVDQILLEDANGGTGGDAILSGLRLQLHTWNGSSMKISFSQNLENSVYPLTIGLHNSTRLNGIVHLNI